MNTINEEPIVPPTLAELLRQQWITHRNNFINTSSFHNTITNIDLPIYNTITNVNTNHVNDYQINPNNNCNICVKKPVTITKTTNSQICECAICFEEKKMAKLNCGHLFCENCVNKINVCALCRSNITNIEI